MGESNKLFRHVFAVLHDKLRGHSIHSMRWVYGPSLPHWSLMFWKSQEHYGPATVIRMYSYYYILCINVGGNVLLTLYFIAGICIIWGLHLSVLFWSRQHARSHFSTCKTRIIYASMISYITLASIPVVLNALTGSYYLAFLLAVMSSIGLFWLSSLGKRAYHNLYNHTMMASYRLPNVCLRILY